MRAASCPACGRGSAGRPCSCLPADLPRQRPASRPGCRWPCSPSEGCCASTAGGCRPMKAPTDSRTCRHYPAQQQTMPRLMPWPSITLACRDFKLYAQRCEVHALHETSEHSVPADKCDASWPCRLHVVQKAEHCRTPSRSVMTGRPTAEHAGSTETRTPSAGRSSTR